VPDELKVTYLHSPTGTQTHIHGQKPNRALCGAFTKGWQRSLVADRMCIRCQKSAKRIIARTMARACAEARR
jgi:hypothetical protein